MSLNALRILYVAQRENDVDLSFWNFQKFSNLNLELKDRFPNAR